MKNYLFLFAITVGLLFSSCNYNDNFDNLDELSKSTETQTYDYTIVDADITTIVSALRANKNAGDSAMATILNTNKVFSVDAPAASLIPYVLKSKFIGANKGSGVNVTYDYKTGTTTYYTLSSSDYTDIWGESNINALAPSKAPEQVLPQLLANKYPDSQEGDVKIIEYQYSASNPGLIETEVQYLFDDFESYEAGSGIAVPTTTSSFLINKDVKGARTWECRFYSSANNKYAQVTSNASGAENEVWLITNRINLSGGINPEFTFNINSGYYNADCLTVLVSENFDGTESGITTATWTDITSNFEIPQDVGYGVLHNAGLKNLSDYNDKNIYIAFKYAGDATSDHPLRTTTYQLDSVKVSEVKTATGVDESETEFASYIFTNGQWLAVTQSYYQLTDEDYAAMGVSTLTSNATALNYAPSYLPTLLKQKFPFAQEGNTKIAVYKTSTTRNSGDEYVFTAGEWKPVSLIETKTEQFVFAGWDNGGWVFDPTMRVTMVKGTADTDDYMLVVNYVRDTYGQETPELLSYYNGALQTEYYYGFAAYYGNISLRESDRLKDPSYAALTSEDEKNEYKKNRTEEGLAIYLSLKFPDAPVQVSGIDVYCYVTTAIYDGVTTSNYVYKFQRVDTDLKWKYIEHSAL